MTEQSKNVAPVAPAAAYVGGKRHLARTLIARIEAVPHRTYAEPFVGMGGVFLRRRQAARSEVINDLSGDVANLFRILQRHYQAFMDMLRWQVTSRSAFDRLNRTDPASLTDLERAARFLYLQRLAFGGKVDGRNFGVRVGEPGRFDVNKLGPLLEDIHERIAGVTIEQLHYAEFLARYDREGSLFYLDPPYWGTEGFYGEDAFSRADFGRLNGLLRSLKGRFILTINDCAGARALFHGFAIETVGVSYGVGIGAKAARELIVSN